jgi:hypothetical protein
MPRFTHLCDPPVGRAGLRCRIIARGALDTIAIQLETGPVLVTSPDRLRKIPPDPQAPERLHQLARIAALAAPHGWDSEDVLFVGWEREAIPWLDSLSQLTRDQAVALISCLTGFPRRRCAHSSQPRRPN